MSGQDRVARIEKIHLIPSLVSLRRLSLLRSIGGDRPERSVWSSVRSGNIVKKSPVNTCGIRVEPYGTAAFLLAYLQRNINNSLISFVALHLCSKHQLQNLINE